MKSSTALTNLDEKRPNYFHERIGSETNLL
jgi:hypothetical protein